jgi:hypothetical protein
VTAVALFVGVAMGCAMLAYLARGGDRLMLISGAVAWAGIAVLAFRLG